MANSNRPVQAKVLKDILARESRIEVRVIDPTQSEQLEQIIDLFEDWHQESVYSLVPFSRKRLAEVVYDLQKNKHSGLLLAIFDKHTKDRSIRGRKLSHDASIVGVLAARLGPMLFSDAMTAYVEHWYIHPQYRNTTAAVRSLTAFRIWGVKNKAQFCVLPTATGARMKQTDLLLRKLGYQLAGGTYITKLKYND